MTRMRQISTDKISENPSNPCYQCSILLVWIIGSNLIIKDEPDLGL